MGVRRAPPVLRAAAAAVLTLTLVPGCLKHMALEAQIEAARDARVAVATLHDYEIARESALAGLGQLEMLHQLDPDNPDALMLLLQGWTGAAAAFIEDDRELALAEDAVDLAEYHRRRALAAYSRGIHYGLLLLAQHQGGFDRASRNADELERWLARARGDAELAETLLWLGQAWLGRVGVGREDPALVADRYVGVALLERSRDLAPKASYGLATAVLAGYHAATGDLARARTLLEEARSVSGGRYLPIRLVEARIHCAAGDLEARERILREIVAAGDPLPAARLQNTIAMRRAQRYLSSPRWRAECAAAPAP